MNKRVSKGYYKDLNDVSTADLLNNPTSAKKGCPYLRNRKSVKSVENERKGKYLEFTLLFLLFFEI